LCALILFATPASAFEAKTPVSDSVLIDESLKLLYDMTAEDENEHFFAGINRLNLQVVKGDYIAGLRYDVESYFEKEEYAIKYLPEKFFLQVDKRFWEARLGDYYANFGRGLTLSMLKNDQFGQDDTLQGATAALKTKYFQMRGLGGWVNEGDSLEFKPYRAKVDDPEYDQRDVLAGGEIWTGHPSYVRVGGSYIYGELPADEDDQLAQYQDDDRVQLISAAIEAPDFDYGAFYGEYAWLEYEDIYKELIDDIEYEGRGAYASLNLFFGPVTFLAEGQDYYRFEFEHNEPPNLEYEKTAFSHAPRRDDIRGYRGRVDLVIPVIDTLVYTAYYNSQTHETNPETAEALPATLKDHYSNDYSIEWIEHTYGGIEKVFDNAAFAYGSGGYRENPEGRWIHGELDAGLPFASHHQVTGSVHAKQFAGMGTFSETEYSSAAYVLEYAFSPYLIVTGIYEKSDEPLSAGVAGSTDDDPNYYSGQIAVDPTERIRVTLFYGREKGGLQCSGGICRPVPPFEGGRVDLQMRF
jgi:Family of unknown function (DUF6029)